MPSYDNTLEEIKNRVDIVEIISEYISLKKAGQNWRGLCPFHSEKTPSFMVSPSKQIYHCFGCGSGGDIFTFLVKYENLSFRESLNILAKKAGVEVKQIQKSNAAPEGKERLLNLNRDALIFYQQSLKGSSRARNYLEKRGITSEAQRLFSIGYAPNARDALLTYLKKNKNYQTESIKKAGLASQGAKDLYSIFRDRIIFPILGLRGEVIAFGARVMDSSMPKYLNSSETPVFSKGRILYGLNFAKESIRKSGFAIFVEGYIDVIIAHVYGFSNVVAPLGTALTQEHGKLIRRFTQEAVIVFDGDESGLKAAKNSIGILLENGLNVKVLPLPEGEDPDSILRGRGKEAFADMLEKAVSIVDFFIMHIGIDSHGQGEKHLVAVEALETISRTPNSVLQGHYIKLLSEKLKINELFIMEELKKIKKRLQRKIGPVKKDGNIHKMPVRVKPLDEIYLLQLILQFPERADEVFIALSVEDFEDPTTKTVFGKMKNGLVSYDNLISECEGDEKNLLTELSFKAGFEDPEKIFKDCIKRLKSKKLQVLLNELQDKIMKAESEKNDVKLKTFLLEKQKLLSLKHSYD